MTVTTVMILVIVRVVAALFRLHRQQPDELPAQYRDVRDLAAMRRSHHLFYRSQLLSLKLDMAVFIPHRIQSATEPCSLSTNLILGRKDSWEHWPIKWLAELYTSASKMIRDCIVSLWEIACAKEQSQMKRFKPGSWRRALDWLVRSPSARPLVLSRLFLAFGRLFTNREVASVTVFSLSLGSSNFLNCPDAASRARSTSGLGT